MTSGNKPLDPFGATPVQLKPFPNTAFLPYRENTASPLPIQSSGDSQEIRKFLQGLEEERTKPWGGRCPRAGSGCGTARLGPSLSCNFYLWEGGWDTRETAELNTERVTGTGSMTARKWLFFLSAIRKAPAPPPFPLFMAQWIKFLHFTP